MENTVELIGHYGGDITHAASAWTSTTRDLTPEKIERIPALLEMLRWGTNDRAKWGNVFNEPHGTPFEKSVLHFLVTTDIASHIHILKHRIGVSVNGESARYKELQDDRGYVPPDWPSEWQVKLTEHNERSFELYHESLNSLTNDYNFDKKRAKESARFFNPYATQLTADVMFNFRSFVHFCNLRAKDSAQYEIRQIALTMIKLVHEIPGNPFEHSLRVWGLTDTLKGAIK